MTDTVVASLGPKCGDNDGRNQRGEPCASTLNLSEVNGRCLFHDESRADELRRIRAAGGAASAQVKRAERIARESSYPEGLPPPPQTIADAMRYASWAVDAVSKGPDGGGIDVRRAREITGLLREFRGAAEKAVLELRVRELEKALRDAKRELERQG